MHENRETSGAPQPERDRGRSAKAQSQKADAHALEESDRTILSMNQTNKEERSSAETGEKRVRAKENIVQSDTSPTQCGEVSVLRIVRCASSSIARQSSKVGAVCGSAARTVLCGGRSVMIVPTATCGCRNPAISIGGLPNSLRREKEKLTIRDTKVQIGSSGRKVSLTQAGGGSNFLFASWVEP